MQKARIQKEGSWLCLSLKIGSLRDSGSENRKLHQEQQAL